MPGVSDYRFPLNQGWECPKCGRVNSPNTATCPCYRGEIVYSGSSDPATHIYIDRGRTAPVDTEDSYTGDDFRFDVHVTC